jgi:membrane protein DedA with SNARE-associated domain
VQTFIMNYGYLAIFVLMLAESACIPVPSELTMLFGGALAGGAVPGAHLNLVLVVAAGVAGNVAGSYLAWGIGRYAGRAAWRRWGRHLLLRNDDIDRAEAAPRPCSSAACCQSFAHSSRCRPASPRCLRPASASIRSLAASPGRLA